MKKNIQISIDIDIDMEGAHDWDDEDSFIENEVRDVIHQMLTSKNGWMDYQTEINPTKLNEFTTFQFDTEIK